MFRKFLSPLTAVLLFSAAAISQTATPTPVQKGDDDGEVIKVESKLVVVPVSVTDTRIGDPVLFWVPSIAISGMTFYTGDRFPAWRGNLFVGGLQQGRIPRTGQMQRIVFNEEGQEVRREAFFTDLRQRIRDVEQGPDGLLYVLTDERDGALLKLEPAQ